jgi:hypothetical protein
MERKPDTAALAGHLRQGTRLRVKKRLTGARGVAPRRAGRILAAHAMAAAGDEILAEVRHSK